jgi:hypothetical protein
MPQPASDKDFVERRSESRKEVDQYYSVEFTINGLDLSYQFRIWNAASKSMCVLVREDSEILPQLKVGEVFNMKYYASNSFYPPEHLETAIRHITKDDQGRFKGHYLVGLEILENRPNEQPH